jgi:hypothetical protein
MQEDLLSEIKIDRVMNAVAAGTTDQTTSTVDMANYDGVMFIALFGTLTATQVTSIYARQGQASNMSDAADLANTRVGPLADADSNKALVLDIYRPQERYVNLVVDRGTANAVIDGVLAVRYRGRKKPVAQEVASVAFSESHVSPAVGTA